MTYKDFVDSLRDLANEIENSARNSQVIDFEADHVAEDDTILFHFEDSLGELYDNLTGKHGHVARIYQER
jgi:hypothetical protein